MKKVKRFFLLPDYHSLSDSSIFLTVWYDLLIFYRNNNLIFRGDLHNLEHFPCYLRKPKAKGEKVKANYFKSVVQEDGEGKQTVEYEKIVFPD